MVITDIWRLNFNGDMVSCAAANKVGHRSGDDPAAKFLFAGGGEMCGPDRQVKILLWG